MDLLPGKSAVVHTDCLNMHILLGYFDVIDRFIQIGFVYCINDYITNRVWLEGYTEYSVQYLYRTV